MIVRTLISTSTSLSFDLQNLISEYSENSYEVQATADGYIDSDYSNIVVYTKLTSFNVFIYDNAGGQIIATSPNFISTIKRLRLNVSGNTATLEYYDDSWTSYSATTFTVDETNFDGLSVSSGSSTLFLSIGATVFVTINSNTNYYSVNDYVSLFSVLLYQSAAEPNRLDKTNYLTLITTVRGTFREANSIISPSINIEYQGVPSFNYVFIPIFNKYYYINDITSVVTNIWALELQEDVLMTYKGNILNLPVFIGKQEFNYDELIADSNIPVHCYHKKEYIPIGTETFDTQTGNNDTVNMVLSVCHTI